MAGRNLHRSESILPTTPARYGGAWTAEQRSHAAVALPGGFVAVFAVSRLYFQPFGGTTLSLTYGVGGLAENTAPLMPLQLCEGVSLSNQKETQGRHLLLHLPFCGRYFSSFLAFFACGVSLFLLPAQRVVEKSPFERGSGPCQLGSLHTSLLASAAPLPR